MLFGLRTLVATFLIALALGMGIGSKLVHDYEAGQRAIAESEASRKLWRSQIANLAEMESAERRLEEVTNRYRKSLEKARAQIPHSPVVHVSPTDGNPDRAACSGDPLLGISAVRLLSDAVQGTVADPAIGRHAEGETASALAVSGLIDHGLQVIFQYHDLAARHDALVDWVEKAVENQRKRIAE